MTSAPLPGEVDVVVAGGGPAGASAAIALRSVGFEVAVVERAIFPRPRIGESLPPKIELLLRILGVERAVETAGFVRMAGTTVSHGGEIVSHDFDPERRSLGYQVDRARFDAILLDRARELGATVVEGASVTDVLRGEGAVRGAIVRTAGDVASEVRARFVVDATGARGALARVLGFRRREAIRTIALAGYWRGSALPRDFAATNTLFEMRPDGWIWSVILDDGRRNVTFGLDPETLKRAGRPAVEVYREAALDSRLVGPLVAGAELASEVEAHDATWIASDEYAGDGFIAAGDAASFIDPLTSHGVYKAMHSGIVGAAVINTVLRRPGDAEMALAYYRELQALTFDKYVDIALTFYQTSPYASSPFWSVRTRRDLEIARAFSPEQVATSGARRERFLQRATGEAGHALPIRALPGLELDSRPVAEGNFIVRKPALVRADQPASAFLGEPFGVDVAALHPLLDGRGLEQLFEGYVLATGAVRSAALGRKLIGVLSALVERGWIADAE